MKFLVTGGMGFIGRHTINELQRTYPNSNIICLDNLSLSEEVSLGSRVEFVKGDVRDVELIEKLIKECDGGVIHLAADSRVLPSIENPAMVLESARTNVLGTANILASLAKFSPNSPIVYAGSSTAYGEVEIPHCEKDLPTVQSPYSATKLSGELLIRSFVVTFGIKATVFRYFQVYGPGQPTSGAYALVTGVFIRQFLCGEPLTIEGNGSQTRDFVHVRDVARANVLGLSKDSRGLPINIGSGQMYSVKQLADMISENQVFRPARRVDLKQTLADIRLAEELIGWSPSIRLFEGIQELLNASKL